LGLLLSAAIHPAGVQDRDGAVPLLRAARRLFPFVEVIFADGAYQGEATASAVAKTGRWRLEIVKRGDSTGFVPLPKRWIVERTFAWLGRCRRLAKDFENLAVNALAFLCLGMIRLMLRRLARASGCS
jgi:transposase